VVPSSPVYVHEPGHKGDVANLLGRFSWDGCPCPGGTLVGGAFSWRMAFGLATAITLTVVAALVAALPSLKSTHQNKFGDGGDV